MCIVTSFVYHPSSILHYQFWETDISLTERRQQAANCSLNSWPRILISCSAIISFRNCEPWHRPAHIPLSMASNSKQVQVCLNILHTDVNMVEELCVTTHESTAEVLSLKSKFKKTHWSVWDSIQIQWNPHLSHKYKTAKTGSSVLWIWSVIWKGLRKLICDKWFSHWTIALRLKEYNK